MRANIINATSSTYSLLVKGWFQRSFINCFIAYINVFINNNLFIQIHNIFYHKPNDHTKLFASQFALRPKRLFYNISAYQSCKVSWYCLYMRNRWRNLLRMRMCSHCRDPISVAYYLIVLYCHRIGLRERVW